MCYTSKLDLAAERTIRERNRKHTQRDTGPGVLSIRKLNKMYEVYDRNSSVNSSVQDRDASKHRSPGQVSFSMGKDQKIHKQ